MSDNRKEEKRNIFDKFRDWLEWWPWAHKIYVKYEELFLYLFIGVLTTIVAWGSKYLFNLIAFEGTAYPTAMQYNILCVVDWTAGVIFSFFTNRKYVFKSNGKMLQDAYKFVLSRISTLLLEIVANQIFGNLLGINVYATTIIAAVLVTVANYFLSKIFVFRKKSE